MAHMTTRRDFLRAAIATPLAQAIPQALITGPVASMVSVGTMTGRFSSATPNIANVPKAMAAFVVTIENAHGKVPRVTKTVPWDDWVARRNYDVL